MYTLVGCVGLDIVVGVASYQSYIRNKGRWTRVNTMTLSDNLWYARCIGAMAWWRVANHTVGNCERSTKDSENGRHE